jgi:Fe-S oxidoreductase
MAGSFGYKSEYYELSMEVGQQLRAQLGDAAADGRVVAASGTSCQEQLEALLEGPVRHPIQLVAPAA